MSKYWKFVDADLKVRRDLDLINDPSISQDEMIQYFNDGVREAAANIHDLGFEDDYFLASSPITIVQGVQNYALPGDMYAHKIRGVIFSQGLSRVYELRPYKRFGKFENLTIDNLIPGDGYGYMYYLDDSQPGQLPQLILVPTPQVAGPFLTVWYVRVAKEVKQINDIIDIPEFISFIFAFVKKQIKIKKKEYGQLDDSEFEKQKNIMIDTLRNQTADNNDDLAMDRSIYWEHS